VVLGAASLLKLHFEDKAPLLSVKGLCLFRKRRMHRKIQQGNSALFGILTTKRAGCRRIL
ncbi:MAG: hypothetical protein RSC36_09695, partial [Ruthenibacterium sp.]